MIFNIILPQINGKDCVTIRRLRHAKFDISTPVQNLAIKI